MKYKSTSPAKTIEFAMSLAKQLKVGDVLALTGELGAGKTCFVKGLAEGLGIPKGTCVRSPSFILINEYRGGRLPLYHIDFYRLDKISDLGELGLDDYIYGDGVTVIEWADRFLAALPNGSLIIRFRIVDERTREVKFVR